MSGPKKYTLKESVIAWGKFAIVAALFGLGLWWMFASVNQHIDKIMREGDSTFAIIASMGYNSMTAAYMVDGREYDYKKAIKTMDNDLLERMREGDTLMIHYMPDDPSEAWLPIESWWKYQNPGRY